jgi:hypothetical protein
MGKLFFSCKKGEEDKKKKGEGEEGGELGHTGKYVEFVDVKTYIWVQVKQRFCER